MKRFVVALVLVLSFCGVADSAYLAQHETAGTQLLCNIEGLTGCNVVANSKYSQLFGIPIADYGIVFYTILFIFAALELVLVDRFLRRVLQAMALAGALISIVLIAIQIFLIHDLCVYCVGSAVIALLAFVLAGFIEPLWDKKGMQSQSGQFTMPPMA